MLKCHQSHLLDGQMKNLQMLQIRQILESLLLDGRNAILVKIPEMECIANELLRFDVQSQMANFTASNEQPELVFNIFIIRCETELYSQVFQARKTFESTVPQLPDVVVVQ